MVKELISMQKQFTPLDQWGLKSIKPLIISGPCSVETKEQMYKVASDLSAYNVSVLRGGIWKPRTRPNAFAGIGKIGLEWLAGAAKSIGIPSAVEVANAEQVEESLKAGIDILWIGARSTVSPFTVQEIADALQGTNIPVMIKNPINPDLELWIGAIERINKAGINKIIAIHRGFSSYEKKNYRNIPNWDIPLELNRRMPDLPLICDPSHICGSRDLIAHVSQKALDLNFNGLIIETHPDPINALSDKEQQLTPAQLGELIKGLVVRDINSENIDFISKLQLLRERIDKIDYDVLELLAERNKLVHEIGIFKKDNNVSIFQPERWAEIVQTRSKYGKEIHLSEELILDMVKAMHRESIAVQTKVMNK